MMSATPDSVFDKVEDELEKKPEHKLIEAIKILQSRDNLVLKTEVKKPFFLAAVDGLMDHLENQGFTQTNSFFETIIDNLLDYRVSYNRKSRDEIIELAKAIAGADLSEDEKDTLTKLLENE